jgi:hypothetical protein
MKVLIMDVYKNNELLIVIGAFGSGKSEYSINLARLHKIHTPHSIALVDLDVVNPYFRSRFVRDSFLSDDIEVIAPDFQYGHADVPMISPRVRGAILDTQRTVILDVGGDPDGCRALARFTDDIATRLYTMQFVVNTKRPFTMSVDEIIEMKCKLEHISQLKITELVCNTNLMELTDISIITQGVEILSTVAQRESLTFEHYLVLDDSANRYPAQINGVKKINLTHYLTKPWEKKHHSNSFC